MANELNFELWTDFVLTDFEKAAMNAVLIAFPGVQCKGCHFHLAQSVYRRIQNANLAIRYGNNENVSSMIQRLPTLAFLSPLEIPQAFEELKNIIPQEANLIVEWFEEFYVLGRVRRVLTRIRDSPVYSGRSGIRSFERWSSNKNSCFISTWNMVCFRKYLNWDFLEFKILWKLGIEYGKLLSAGLVLVFSTW